MAARRAAPAAASSSSRVSPRPKRARVQASPTSIAIDIAESTPVRASFHALPTDVLALVFAHAPFAARMRTISRVCKRWHIAALRSVTRVPLARIDEHKAAEVLALFPAVTALSVRRLPAVAFPTALRELALYGPCWHTGAGPNPLLEAHFPALTSLSLIRSTEYVYPTPVLSVRLEAFLARHHSTIRSLVLKDANDAMACVTKFAWPALRSLKIRLDGALPFLRSLTNLTSLALTCSEEAAPDVMTLPDHCVAALTSLHVTVRRRNARLEAWLLHVPRLARLSYEPEPRPLRSLVTTARLGGVSPWANDLADYVCMTKLVLLPRQFLLPDLSCVRPALRKVAIGCTRAEFEVAEALMLASHVIRELPLLRSLSVAAKRKYVGGARLVALETALKGLVWLARERGVAKLKIALPDGRVKVTDATGWVDVCALK